MRALAWFEVTVGVAIAGLWTGLLATGQVPEIAAAQRDIWFHLGAEFLTAGLLVAGGVALLRRAPHARRLAAVGLGALLYTTVNSAGYYADDGAWAIVAMFLVLAAVTALLAVRLVRRPAAPTGVRTAAPQPRAPARR